MKLIMVDNYAREDVSDKLIAENVDKYHGELIVAHFNSHDPEGPHFYKLVEDDYVLFEFEGY